MIINSITPSFKGYVQVYAILDSGSGDKYSRQYTFNTNSICLRKGPGVNTSRHPNYPKAYIFHGGKKYDTCTSYEGLQKACLKSEQSNSIISIDENDNIDEIV